MAASQRRPGFAMEAADFMPSEADIAGIRRDIEAYEAKRKLARPAVGITMFGVTTPCVQAVTRHLESEFDCLVFHATGTGGRAMEALGNSGLLAGFLDITTTEIADMLIGGVFPADELLPQTIAFALTVFFLCELARPGTFTPRETLRHMAKQELRREYQDATGRARRQGTVAPQRALRHGTAATTLLFQATTRSTCGTPSCTWRR